MTAYLGFYDMGALAQANDLYWSEIRRHLGYGPAHLLRPDDLWPIWRAPDLVLAQTCSLPYRAHLHREVTLVGTPDFGLPGCPPGYYRSAMVTRAGDRLRDGLRMAINDSHSQSGWGSPLIYLMDRRITPGDIVVTGAHAASVQALADGRADIAGIDLLSWTLLDEQGLLPAGLVIHDVTPPTLAPPYIAAAGTDPGPLACAIAAAIDTLPDQTRQALHLRGLVQHGKDAYLAEPVPRAPTIVAA